MRYGFLTVAIQLFMGSLNPVIAQQQIFKNYTVNDGLISNSIRRIFQDSKGFLWIATWEGLSKYDGYSFTNYSTANGLSHNLVNDFYESTDGKLYVALNDGNIDVIADGRIISKAISGIVINRFIQAPGKPVVVATDTAGLQEFRAGALIPPKQKFRKHTYMDVTWLNDSLLLAASDSSLEVFNKNLQLVTETPYLLTQLMELKIYLDSKKRIWVSNYAEGLKLLAGIPRQGQLPVFTSPTEPFNIPELQHKKINAILEDEERNIWFGTTAGIIKINADGSHQFITVKDGLTSNIITSLFQDKEKNIWIGTAVGLSKLVTKTRISLYTLENGLSSNDNLYLLYAIKKDYLLVSSPDGPLLFSKHTGRFSPIRNGNHRYFYSLVANTNPPLLLGSNEMAIIDTNTFNYKDVYPLPLNLVVRMICDKSHHFFVSDLRQLYFTPGKAFQSILDYRISSLLLDREGCLWAGTWSNGLFRFRYSIQHNTFRAISKEHFLPDENIRTLFEDSKGNIWAGTRYKGVYRINNHNFSISKFDQSNGLSSNFIRGIREDTKGNFWIAFHQGLDKLIFSDSNCRVFNFSRINNYFTSVIGIEIDEDHSLWLATGEGLTHINDGEMEKLPPLPVYITKVFSADSAYPLSANRLQLNYLQNQLQFEFSSPGFINEKQLVYSYRLSGSSSTEWTKASNQHIVSYASLQPGNYLFEVKVLGWNGKWGAPAIFKFRINPPFWQTWWFRCLSVSLAVFIMYASIRRVIKGIRYQATMKQHIAETEMMALRTQMNPHFIFNCLNSIDNLIQMNEKEKATSYLSKFAKLIRSILENAKNNVVPCWKDMETLKLYLELEALRFDNKFSYRVTIADAIMQGDYKVPPLVIQPFVENAIHHGLLNKRESDKKLNVDVSVTPTHIRYQIEDNGVGRTQAAAYKQLNKPAYESMGLQITDHRINLFNQQAKSSVKITDLYDASARPAGTRVEVDLIIQP